VRSRIFTGLSPVKLAGEPGFEPSHKWLYKRYKMRALGENGLNIVVSIPRVVIERQAEKHGLTVEEFRNQFKAVANFGNFEGVAYTFEKSAMKPGPHGPEPGVLPLDYSPATDGGAYDPLQSKSSPLPGLSSGVVPVNLGAGIGQNPARAHLIIYQVRVAVSQKGGKRCRQS